MPKTGTSSLQKSIFPSFGTYLGRGGPIARDELAKRCRELMLIRSEGRTERKLRKWSADVLREYGRLTNPEGRILLSEERLAWPARDHERSAGVLAKMHPMSEAWLDPAIAHEIVERPIVPMLGYLARRGIWAAGEVKVILTVRQQSEWLASLFAQHPLRPNSGESHQDAFEAFVRGIVRREWTYLQWSAWIRELSSVLGPENVHCILLEDLDSDDVMKALARFLGYKSMDFDSLRMAFGTRHNVRRVHVNKWAVKRTAESVKRSQPEEARKVRDGGRPVGEIELTEEMRTIIQGHFHESNRLLGELLGRDVHSVGY